jgi:hypothetical protein
MACKMPVFALVSLWCAFRRKFLQMGLSMTVDRSQRGRAFDFYSIESFDKRSVNEMGTVQRLTTSGDQMEPRSSNWSALIVSHLTVGVVVGLALALIAYLAKQKGVGEIVFYGIAFAGVVLIVCGAWLTYLYMSTFRRKRELELELTECKAQYKDQLASMGITDIALSLKDSSFSPSAVMSRAHHQVRFLGFFGHIWVADENGKRQFRDMLTRVQLNGGRVQFLLLDPNCAAAKRLVTMRDHDPKASGDFASVSDSVKYYFELTKEYDCFELRLFDHVPFLWLIFVDSLCAVSRFKLNPQATAALEAPLLVFAPENPGGVWTMYQPFLHLFEFLWERKEDPSPTMSKHSGTHVRRGQI